jgi:hypothetical protein
MNDRKTYQWVEKTEAAPCPEWVAQLGDEDVTPEGRIAKVVKEILPFGKERKGNWRVRCPFPPHNDNIPSCDVRLGDGVYHCFGCGQKGRIEDLYAHIKNVTKDEARRIIYPPPAWVGKMNEIHAVITDFAGKCVILNESRDPLSGWKKVTFSSLADLRGRYRSRSVLVGKNYMSVADAWFRHRDRREFQGIVFAPGKSTPGYYNLFQGFPVSPRPGDCGLFKQFIRDIICSGNEEYYEYLIHWFAFAVQRPSERPEVALVFKGVEGVGKGTLVSNFGKLFGPHFKQVWNTRQVVGNFNAHLADAIVLFADEALWPGNREGIGALKALITEKTIPLEYKGKDLVHVDNHVHLIIATNEDWAVPAGPQARRFFVLEVSDAQMQKGQYFGPIENEMKNGGLEAFFDMLLKVDLTGVDLRKIPLTGSLIEAKLRTMEGTPEGFWYSVLVRRTLLASQSNWNQVVERVLLHDEYDRYAKQAGMKRRSTETQLGMALKKVCPHRRPCMIGSTRGWNFGDLKRCQDAFCRYMKWTNHTWDTEDECILRPESVSQIKDQGQDERPVPTGTSATEPTSRVASIEEYENFDRFHE